jgi:hypothetical protein
MNIQKMIAVSGLALLTAAPFAAATERAGKAADACIQAFVDTHLPKGHTVRVHKVAPPTSPLDSYAKRYTLELSARVASDRANFVTARCVVSANGEVLALESLPL